MPAATSYTIKFKSESTIYQTQVRCRISENEYNLTLNPTITSDTSGSIRAEMTGSNFGPYATTIGLYNEVNELLMVAKLAQPFPIPANTDVIFLIRYDT